MKSLSRAFLSILLAAFAITPVFAADGPVKLQSLRGNTSIAETPDNDMSKPTKDSKPIPRDFTQQPPLIPHTVRDYQITINFNKCMDCHSWERYREFNATKVSQTHFKDRDGNELDNVSSRRYFCTQCHVPQADAKPLVDNTFKAAAGMRR
ncbi:MAG: nitrate reductase cytochrome c-type subunit [Zoogloeaceae bacterium]|jgi:cytochrome c-type protein NapB|nr:nitrate reductase cytochrome c-type subunit [Zoogloeaceae bacterium]